MEWQTKLEKSLGKLLEGKPSDNINENLENLVSFFNSQKVIQSRLINHPILLKWIKQAVTFWTSNKRTPSGNIASFTLNLSSFLSRNEENFCSLNTDNFYVKLIKLTKVDKTAYINLLSSFLQHKSGIEWMTACSFWEDIYHFALSEDEEIVEASTQFITILLEKTIDYDESFCDRVVIKIMSPLGDNVYKSLKASEGDNIDDEVASMYLKPILKLIGNILLYFIDGIYFKKNDFGLVLIFLKNFHLEERISDFMIIAQSKSLVFEISRIMFIMQFLELYVKIITNSINAPAIAATINRIRKNFVTTIAKKNFESIVAEMSNFGILYWNLLSLKIPHQSLTQLSPAIDFIMMLTGSNFCVLMKYCYSKISEIEDVVFSDDIRSLFMSKVFKNMNSDVFRISRPWKRNLMTEPNTFMDGVRNLTYIKNSRKYFFPQQAIQVFQGLMYLLIDVVRTVKERPAKFDIFVQEPQYFGLVFELVRSFIEDFHIKWSDCCKTMEVMTVCFDYLVLPGWPSIVVVEILKLINVAITNYMSPNLALLVDGSSDSVVTLLGPLLYSKLRKNALKMDVLEVVFTMTVMSKTKFPFLRRVLLDSEMPSLIVKLAFQENEEKALRTMAIKCLQEVIQVEEIWKIAIEKENLAQKMCDVVLSKSDKNIRVEAAIFLRVTYQHHQIPEDALLQTYETMVRSATTDTHWKVRNCVLDFWNKVIENHLQNQGMIDGSFPPVTFSKEHKKIITLTDSEIRKRLLKVVNQLASIGCLNVLMSAVKSDRDVAVSKTAVKMIKQFVDLLEKYNVRNDDNALNDRSSVCCEFFKFCQDFDCLVHEKTKWLHEIEDLDLILDNILKTYDCDSNNMDL